MRGRIPYAPIRYLTEMRFDEAAKGQATLSIPASPWFQQLRRDDPGGMLAVLADSLLGASLYSELSPGVGFTAAELSLTMLRPVRPDPKGRIAGGGRVIHRGRTLD